MSSHKWVKERGHIFKYKLFPIDLNLCSIYCWFQTNGYSLEVALQGNAASKAPMWTKIFIWDVKIKNFVDNSFDSADREVKAVFIFLVHLLKQSGKKGFFRDSPEPCRWLIICTKVKLVPRLLALSWPFTEPARLVLSIPWHLRKVTTVWIEWPIKIFAHWELIAGQNYVFLKGI